jgi:hypothetical protein
MPKVLQVTKSLQLAFSNHLIKGGQVQQILSLQMRLKIAESLVQFKIAHMNL